MDELTESTRTVLMAVNCEFEGPELTLVRSNYADALITVTAPENTSLTIDLVASEAARWGDGVTRR